MAESMASRWNGPMGRGAARAVKDAKRAEAEARQQEIKAETEQAYQLRDLPNTAAPYDGRPLHNPKQSERRHKRLMKQARRERRNLIAAEDEPTLLGGGELVEWG